MSLFARNIQHPGIEVRQTESRQNQSFTFDNARCLVFGFSRKGSILFPQYFNDLNEFQENFGTPSTEAEQYFYQTAKEIILNNGIVLAARLPYSDVSGNYDLPTNTENQYVSIPVTLETPGSELSSFYSADDFMIGSNDPYNNDFARRLSQLIDEAPSGATSGQIFIKVNIHPPENISRQQVMDMVQKESFATADLSGDFRIIDISRENIEFDQSEYNDFSISGSNLIDIESGLIISISDMIDGVAYQDIFGVSGYTFEALQKVGLNKTLSGNEYFLEIDPEILESNLTSNIYLPSISKSIMSAFPKIEAEIKNFRVNVISKYSKCIVLNISRLYKNRKTNKSRIRLLESHFGSIEPENIDRTTRTSTYICDVVNTNSKYIRMYANESPKIFSQVYATARKGFVDIDGVPYSYGYVSGVKNLSGTFDDYIPVPRMVDLLNTVFSKISDNEKYPLDIVVDAGISTIASTVLSGGTGNEPAIHYDSLLAKDILAETNYELDDTLGIQRWYNYTAQIDEFCRSIRKDCMAIFDVPRSLELVGNTKKVIYGESTFSTAISPKLKYVNNLNSSYSAIYSNWVKIVNPFSKNLSEYIWVPPTSKTAAVYCRCDAGGKFWDAPAGMNRGRIGNVIELAFNPGDIDMDRLYLANINYFKQYFLDGIQQEGQKTSFKKPSAFDRINVRRLFLKMEKYVNYYMKRVLYEPNNLFTRNKIILELTPFFTYLKKEGGVYDFRIVCDNVVNTPEMIDRNEFRIIFLIKPAKTLEFIVIDFRPTKSGSTFDILDNVNTYSF